MKKGEIKLLLLTIIMFASCFFIWKYTINDTKKMTDAERFSNEYTLVDKDNIFKYISPSKSYELLNKKSGILFMCFPESKWCQTYASILNEAAIENDIKEINYLNLKNIRSNTQNNYIKLRDKLIDYIPVDDEGIKTIYAPNTTFVNNGVIVANNNDTSIIHSEMNPNDYWTNERINKFKKEIMKNIQLMNESTNKEALPN